ncbi:MAG: PDDEXK nuclease domain-containing protein [Eggerthellaceae bacterium]|nr:PDDEXK nuclease domain-containing protein [Eggerthellaceae bacterium]
MSKDIAKKSATGIEDAQLNRLCEDAFSIIEAGRKNAYRAVNVAMVYSYFELGRRIVEEEQNGSSRAGYGAKLLTRLAAALTERYGRGFSDTNLRQMRNFYLVYSEDEIQQTLSAEFAGLPKTQEGRVFPLSWSHYLKLMRIKDIDERHFYEAETAKNNWSLAELNRQFDSALYERLTLSRDKDEVKKLAEKGQIVEKPSDLVKDPYVLEFVGLEEKPSYSESDLEGAIIDNLEKFLLEMGRGFTFVGRQVRFTFDEEHYFVDLVLFNRLLSCFVLVDLKIGKLRHQDLGQMQMYVNYFDRYERLESENPTIGIVLCKDKNDSMVELTLPKDNERIFASRYQTVLPSKDELRQLMDESAERFEATKLSGDVATAMEGSQ